MRTDTRWMVMGQEEGMCEVGMVGTLGQSDVKIR